jgi:hypothetical protein
VRKVRFYNRSNHSLAVSLNDGTTGFVPSKDSIEVLGSQISADLLIKEKKGFLVRMSEVKVIAREHEFEGGSEEPSFPKQEEPTELKPASFPAARDLDDVLEDLDGTP